MQMTAVADPHISEYIINFCCSDVDKYTEEEEEHIVTCVDNRTRGDVIVPMPVMVPRCEDLLTYHNVHVNVATLRIIHAVLFDDSSSTGSTTPSTSTTTTTTTDRYTCSEWFLFNFKHM